MPPVRVPLNSTIPLECLNRELGTRESCEDWLNEESVWKAASQIRRVRSLVILLVLIAPLLVQQTSHSLDLYFSSSQKKVRFYRSSCQNLTSSVLASASLCTAIAPLGIILFDHTLTGGSVEWQIWIAWLKSAGIWTPISFGVLAITNRCWRREEFRISTLARLMALVSTTCLIVAILGTHGWKGVKLEMMAMVRNLLPGLALGEL